MDRLPPREIRFNSAIFFENSLAQRRGITSNCQSASVVVNRLTEAPPSSKFVIVAIPETEPVIPRNVTGIDFYRPDNLYITTHNIRQEYYDPVCGIRENHITKILNPWIASRPAEGTHVAIFDWDRTVSLVEGVFLEDASQGERREYYNQMLEFICGGAARLAMLKAMFRNLLDNEIQLIFLTNNLSGTKPTFSEMIDALLDNDPVEYYIIVSAIPKYGGQKFNVFKMEPYFNTIICTRQSSSAGISSSIPRSGETTSPFLATLPSVAAPAPSPFPSSFAAAAPAPSPSTSSFASPAPWGYSPAAAPSPFLSTSSFASPAPWGYSPAAAPSPFLSTLPSSFAAPAPAPVPRANIRPPVYNANGDEVMSGGKYSRHKNRRKTARRRAKRTIKRRCKRTKRCA